MSLRPPSPLRASDGLVSDLVVGGRPWEQKENRDVPWMDAAESEFPLRPTSEGSNVAVGASGRRKN